MDRIIQMVQRDRFKAWGQVLRSFAIVVGGAVLLARAVPVQAAVSIGVNYSPASGTIAQNGTLAMAINITGSQPVQGIQLRVTFDATKLQYQSISYGTALDYTDPAAGVGGSGAGSYFQINQAKLGAAPTPPFALATITFKAIAASGTATVGYDAANSVAYDTSAGSSPISTFSGATYTLDGVAPTVSITAPSTGSTASGTVNLSATAADTGSGITKVELLIDGAVVSTDTTSPYAFSFNSASYSDASHTLVARAYDGVGNSATSSVTVTFKNKSTTTTPSSPTNSTSQKTTTPAPTTTPSSASSTPTATQTPTTDGVKVASNSQYSVSALKDKPVTKRTTSRTVVYVGAGVVGACAITGGGFVLYRLRLRRRLLMRHVASVPSGATPYDFQHQQPIAPVNLPQGPNVITPTEPQNPPRNDGQV